MIITKAPMRTSFAGGGTDLRQFYSKETGSVISSAINKYVSIVINRHFDNKFLLKYSRIELVDNINDIQNELFRECLRFMDIKRGIEITSLADLPEKTGLGSSSSFTVALLHALHTYNEDHVTPKQLAEEACHIEVDVLERPIGKQDQYIAAYGGLKVIEFHPDENVSVTPLVCKNSTLEKLNDSLMMFYTGITRSSNKILSEQKKVTDERRDNLRNMKLLSEEIRDALVKGNLEKFGKSLHEGWLEKRKLTSKISNNLIDKYYEKAINAGASGGKLLGAGGGGFLLFYCEKANQEKLRNALKNLRELKFKLENQGSKIISLGD